MKRLRLQSSLLLREERELHAKVLVYSIRYISTCFNQLLCKTGPFLQLGSIGYTHTALRYLEDEHENAFPEGDTTKWLQSWRIEDLSDKCPQQENDFDCGIFHLLNLCLLVNEGGISLESYSQASININTKEVRKIVAYYLLWAASSNHPVVKTRYE